MVTEKFAILLLFLLSSLFGNAQPVLESIPPEFIEPCGPTYDYALKITNESNQVIGDITLSYKLPNGFIYEVNSARRSDVRDQDVSDLNHPSFQLPDIPPGIFIMEFKVIPTCDAKNNLAVLQDSVTFHYNNGETISYKGTLYNLATPSLTITEVTNQDTSISLNGVFERTYTIFNNGFATFTQLFIEDLYDPDAIQILDISPGRIADPDRSVFIIDGSDFSGTGDRDRLFEPGEYLVFKETVKLIGCGDAKSTVQFSWGCNDNICGRFSQLKAFVKPNSDFPILEYRFDNEQYVGFCSDGRIELTIKNTAKETVRGAATAYDLLLDPVIDNFLDDRNPCFELDNFLVNGQSVRTNSIRGFGNQINLVQFTTDPDGPGGLEDLDGDGQFDDLAVGESFKLSFDMFLDQSCTQDICNNHIRRQDFVIEAELRSSCGRQRSTQLVRGEEHYYELDNQAIEENLQIEYFDESNVGVTLIFEDGMAGFDESCVNDSTIVKIRIPDILSIPADFSPRYNDRKVSFDLTGNILSVFINEFPGELELRFDADCAEITQRNQALPCGGYNQEPDPLHRIIYWTEYYCDTKTCVDPQIIQCDTTRSFITACPYNPGEVGFTEFTFDGRRTSLGWKDHTQSRRVNPDNDNLNIRTAMSYDTVSFTYSSKIAGPGIFDTAAIRLSYYYEAYKDLIEYIGDTLEFYDAETDQWIICPNIGLQAEYITPLKEKRYEFSLFQLTEPGGCLEGMHLTDGDLIRFKAYYIVSANAPIFDVAIPDLRGKFFFDYLGETWDCSSRRTRLTVFSPTVGNKFDFDYSGEGCDTIEMVVAIRQGRRGSSERDYFPFEYRSLIDWQDLSLELPDWVNYVPGSSRYQYMYRERGEAAGPILLDTILVPDPRINATDSLNYLYYDIHRLNLPADYISESTETVITFKVVPKCLSGENITVTQLANYYTNAYSENYLIQDSIANERVINYRIGERSFYSPNARFLGLTDTAAWNFELNLRKGESRIVPNSWLYLDFEPNTVIPTFLIEQLSDGSTFRHELIQIPGTEDYWVKIGQLVKDSTRRFRLLGDVDECRKTSFFVYTDFDCRGYPNDLRSYVPNCDKPRPFQELILDPQQANILIRLGTTPPPIRDLCAPLVYEFEGLINKLGGVFGLDISMTTLGPGMNILPGTSSFKLNDGSFVPIPDPVQVPGTQTYEWELGNLSARLDTTAPVNSFRLQFQLQLDCDYVHPSIFTYSSQWRDFCGVQAGTRDLVAPPVLILDLPTQTNTFLLDMEGLDFEACGGDNRLKISLENRGGALGDRTNEFEFIRLIIPAGMDYVPGSFIGIHNVPSEDPIMNYVEDGFRKIQWPMPIAVEKGDSIVFEIDLNTASDAKLDCGREPIQMQTAELRGIPCSNAPGGFCTIAFRPSLDDFFFNITKPEIQPSFRSASASVLDRDNELFKLDIQLENISPLVFDDVLELAYYFDVNGNQQFDPGIDELAGRRKVPLNLAPNELIDTLSHELAVPTDFTCYGILLVIDPDRNYCVCDRQLAYQGPVPLDNLPIERDTFCLGSPLAIGTIPQAGYTYYWMPNEYIDDPLASQTAFLYTGSIPKDSSFSETLILTTTRAGGCFVQDSIQIDAFHFEVDLGILDTVSCSGDNTAQISALVSGGAPEYQFLWNNGLPDQAQQDSLGAGLYELTVTDAAGCSTTASIDINEPAPIRVSFQASDYNGLAVSCFEGTDGRLSIQATGGIGSYSYQWNTGNTGSVLNAIGAGTYTVTVTDQNNCAFVDSFTLDQPLPLEIEGRVDPILCFDQREGAIELVSTGGVRPYRYNWSAGHSSESINNLPAGRYEVTLTDRNGCVLTDTFELDQPSELELRLQTKDIQCFNVNDGLVRAEATGGTGSYSYLWNTGSTLDSLADLATGTYQLTVTDSVGCSVTETAFINQPDELTVQLGIEQISCFGEADGRLIPTISGGTGPYQFLWNDSSTAERMNNLAVGDYVLTVTDANGCRSEASATIQQPEPLSLNIERQTISCFDADDGVLNALASGGTGPFTFSWSNGALGSTINNIGPEQYTVTVVDANGCALTDTATLTQPAPLQLSMEETPVTCFDGADGTIRSQVSGGTGAYSYQWNTGSVSDSIGDLPAGNYSLVVQDQRGCTLRDELTLTNPAPLQINTTVKPVSCEELIDGSVTAVVSGGVGAYNLEWSTGSTDAIIVDIPVGTYALTVTDEIGCSLSVNEEVPILPAIQITTVVDSIDCFGAQNGSVLAEIQGGANQYAFNWNTGAASPGINNLQPGVYSLTVTDTNGCTDSAMVELFQPTLLQLETFPQMISCFNENNGRIATEVSGGRGLYQYQWSNGDTDEIAEQLSPGLYGLTITDQNGCTVTNTTMISQPDLLELQLAEKDMSCFNQTDGQINTTVTGGTFPYTYQWNNGSTTAQIDSLEAAAYSLTVTDGNGCTVTATETIVQPPDITLSFQKEDIRCFGGTNGLIVGIVEGGNSPYQYQWNTGHTGSSLSNLRAGRYELLVVDQEGCQINGVVELSQPDELHIQSTISPVSCFAKSDGSISVNVVGGVQPYDYRWSTGESVPALERLRANAYTVSVTDLNGCVSSKTIDLPQPNALRLESLVQNVTCPNGSDGFIRLEMSGGAPPFRFQWSNGASTDELESINSGSYSVTIEDSNGCATGRDFMITQPPPLILGAGVRDVACVGGSDGRIVIQKPLGEGFSYKIEGTGFQTDTVFSNLMEGTYRLTVKDINNCQAETDVTIKTVPRKLVFAPEDVTIEYGEQVPLEVIVDPTVIDPPMWSPGESLDCDLCLETIAKPLITTGYTIEVINEGGCIDQDIVLVYVKEPRDYFIPTAFSPNGDGINDLFTIFSTGDVTNINYLKIFDRWGQLIFERQDFKPNDLSLGWDGYFRGQPLNSAVFVVMAELEFIDNRTEVVAGDVALMK